MAGSAAREPELVFEAGDARAVVRPAEGGRLASFAVGGRELLVTEGETHPMQWGSFPMAPFAGRIRRGIFTFQGREHRLPLGLPPHAIHGMAYDRPWRVVDASTIAIDLDERWPFRARVEQRFALDGDGLELSLTLLAEEPQPITLGWHPWFRRVLAAGAAPARLLLEADAMLERDAEGIPTGARISPPPSGPWDDAFTGVREGPALEWPGQVRLELSSSCPWWVVYTVPDHAICIEPQSGPPDAANQAPEVVVPGAPLTHTMRWRWTCL